MEDILLKEISVSEIKEYYNKMRPSMADDFVLHLRHKNMSAFIEVGEKTLEKLCAKDFLDAKYYLEIRERGLDNDK